MKDYYKILEVEENSSEQDIKKSYRTLSKKYHPDVNPDGTEKFKDIAEAYEILGDPNKRVQYDNSKKNPFMGGSSMDDIMSQMFGNSNFFGNRRRKQAPDKLVKVQISPIESYNGIEKTIQYMKENACEVCNGSGGDTQVCGTCRGQGFTIRNVGTGFILQQFRTVCNNCGGRGYTLVHRCYSCDGRGSKSSINTLNVKLPVGADDGQFMRIENMGDFKNGEHGDLVIQLEMVSKDGFEKMNNDLIYNLYLNYDQLNDEKYVVPHPEGDVSINAPKLFDTSKPLRLRNRGYSGGDMFVKLNVKFERNG
jgi:molecular chaperone DnaJ